MGRFRRLSIEEARDEFPLLNEEAKKKLKGGCDFHKFFGDGLPHPMEEIEISLNINHNGGDIVYVADCQKWICGEGWIVVNGYDSWLESSQMMYKVCKTHYLYFHVTENCFPCTHTFCDTHGYFSNLAMGPYCPECPTIVYCDTHDLPYLPYQPCYGCVEEDFLEKYPDGCFEHGKQEACTICEAEFELMYPDGCFKHKNPEVECWECYSEQYPPEEEV